MKNVIIILLSVFLLSSYQSSDSTDFTSPRAVVETFIDASRKKDKDVLSRCFSDQSPGEWDKIRNKTVSKRELKELKNFVAGAVITKVEMKGEIHADVFVTLKSRNEEIHTVKADGRWFISDF